MGNIASVVLKQTRITKNTVRFDVDAANTDSPIASLYVEKRAFPDGKFPAAIHVTVEVFGSNV